MDILSIFTRKARKEHKCNWCSQSIKKGEIYEVQRNLDEGLFYTWKSHLKCSEVFDKLSMGDFHDGDGVNEIEFMHVINSFLDDNLSIKEFEELKDEELVSKALLIIREEEENEK